MVQIIVFALVLIAVFALKAVSIMFDKDALVGKQAAFSWMAPCPADVKAAEAAAEEEPVLIDQPRMVVRSKRAVA